LLVEVDAGRALLGAGGLVVEAGLGGEVVARHAAGEADLVGEVRIGAHRRGAAAVEHAGIGQPGEVQRVAVVVEAAAVLRHADTVAAGRRAGEAEAPAVELDRRAGGVVAGAVGDGVAAARTEHHRGAGEQVRVAAVAHAHRAHGRAAGVGAG